MANRHGLIADATGTGKTVTLQNLTEGFSRIGVPVFLADEYRLANFLATEKIKDIYLAKAPGSQRH